MTMTDDTATDVATTPTPDTATDVVDEPTPDPTPAAIVPRLRVVDEFSIIGDTHTDMTLWVAASTRWLAVGRDDATGNLILYGERWFDEQPGTTAVRVRVVASHQPHDLTAHIGSVRVGGSALHVYVR